MKRKFEEEKLEPCKRIKENNSCDLEQEEFYTIEMFIREYISKTRRKKELKNKKKVVKYND
jgi:hypothetical protein